MSQSASVEIILGIDPGLTCTGWGVVRKQGSKLVYVDSGKLRTKASEPMAERHCNCRNRSP
ncbi:MAG: crossover junction endodeoxyribonuclease RuvC [bacterium]|nr:crossover junction endodeoxyribonuclease RuvC [bacterium]